MEKTIPNEQHGRRPRGWMAAIGLGALLMGCNSASAADPNNPPPNVDSGVLPDGSMANATDYLPLAVGKSWMYRITNAAGMMANKMTTIEAMEPADGMNGPVAFRVRNESLDGTTVNWEQQTGTGVVRYRQQVLDGSGHLVLEKTYAPSSVVLDESAAHLVAGATWAEAYSETKPGATGAPKPSQEVVRWTVEAQDDVVLVPAGTFTCIRVRRHHSTGNSPTDEVTWYAPGTGRVKQTGGGTMSDQTRELVSVSP